MYNGMVFMFNYIRYDTLFGLACYMIGFAVRFLAPHTQFKESVFEDADVGITMYNVIPGRGN